MYNWKYVPQSLLIGGSESEEKIIYLKTKDELVSDCEITIVNQLNDEVRIHFSMMVLDWLSEDQGIGNFEAQGQKGKDSFLVMIPLKISLQDVSMYLVANEMLDPIPNFYAVYDEETQKRTKEEIVSFLLNEAKVKFKLR